MVERSRASIGERNLLRHALRGIDDLAGEGERCGAPESPWRAAAPIPLAQSTTGRYPPAAALSTSVTVPVMAPGCGGCECHVDGAGRPGGERTSAVVGLGVAWRLAVIEVKASASLPEFVNHDSLRRAGRGNYNLVMGRLKLACYDPIDPDAMPVPSRATVCGLLTHHR